MSVLERLAELADALDEKGLHAEADMVDALLKTASGADNAETEEQNDD